MPPAALALNYWLHLLATIVWIGGLAVLVMVVWPGITKGADAKSAQDLMEGIERRFRPWANISLAVLLVTGIIQMGDDPHYTGFLIVDSVWAWGLLAKHILIGGMILVSLVTQGNTLPALDRAKLLEQRGKEEGITQAASMRRQLRWLTVANLVLGITVLLITAIITAQE